MVEVRVDTVGIQAVREALNRMGPSFQNRLLGPALGAAADVVRRQARMRGFGFTDRNAPREGPRRFKSLRQSIRARRIAAIYEGRRFKRGRAAVFAGGDGARQAHLVELGHEGPQPARPHSFLAASAILTAGRQAAAVAESARARFPRLAAELRARAGRNAVSTVARRRR